MSHALLWMAAAGGTGALPMASEIAASQETSWERSDVQVDVVVLLGAMAAGAVAARLHGTANSSAGAHLNQALHAYASSERESRGGVPVRCGIREPCMPAQRLCGGAHNNACTNNRY
eukprot:1155379-Pleurochrysis_carterae.AAC.1